MDTVATANKMQVVFVPTFDVNVSYFLALGPPLPKNLIDMTIFWYILWRATMNNAWKCSKFLMDSPIINICVDFERCTG